MSTTKDVCRVCRKEKSASSGFTPLFLKPEASDDETLAGMFEFVANVAVIPEETNMPQEICSECLEQLKTSYRFRRLCIESDEMLRKELNNSEESYPAAMSLSQGSLAPAQSSRSNANAVYLDEYDASFYHVVLDRYYYMVLNFVAHRCCGCRQAFATEEQLLDHSKQMHQKDQSLLSANQCPVCYMLFPYEDALNYHRQSVQGNIYCCRECYIVLEKKRTLCSHLRGEHGRAESELERELDVVEDEMMGHSIFDPDPEPNLSVCHVQSLADGNVDTFGLGYCELSPELKLSHLRTSQYKVEERSDDFSIIQFTWHRCCACNHMFSSKAELDIHCTEEHRKKYFPVQSYYGMLKPFLCQQCWRRFKKKSLLGLHQKFNRKKVYACNHCLHIYFGRPAYEKHRPFCAGSDGDGQVNPIHITAASGQAYVGHQMTVDLKEEPEEDDDVYILND